MKHLTIGILIVFLALFSSAWCCGNADPSALPAVTGAWHDLRAAILSGKIERVAALAHFPIQSIDAHRRELGDEEDLRGVFDKIFDPALIGLIEQRQCDIARGGAGYEVDCGDGYMILGFQPFDGEFRFSYYGSINE